MIAPTESDSILPLEQMKINQVADVVEVLGATAEIQRLSEMGLHHGTRIRMLKSGTPCLLALDGKRLSIRLSPDVDIYVLANN